MRFPNDWLVDETDPPERERSLEISPDYDPDGQKEYLRLLINTPEPLPIYPTQFFGRLSHPTPVMPWKATLSHAASFGTAPNFLATMLSPRSFLCAIHRALQPRPSHSSHSRRTLTTTPATLQHPTQPYPSTDPPRTTHFGFQDNISEEEKRRRVASVFTSVAESYDRMNDLMSFGWHRIWKDHFVSSLNPGFNPLSTHPCSPQRILDIAGGTGDIALRMLHTAHNVNQNPNVRVTISDINPDMLAVGKLRSESLSASQQAALSFIEANAEDLTKTKPLWTSTTPHPNTNTPSTHPVPSSSIDLYTIAFGIRNFSNIPAALREAHRVLKPGGVFACLEFSKADAHPLFNAVYKRWSFSAIPLIGQLVAGDRDSYQYLVESIERFPRQDEFTKMIADAGFSVCGQGWENLTGGVAAIHKGVKPKV